MRLLEFFTRDVLLKLTALFLALLLWALVETGNRNDAGAPSPGVPEVEDSTQSSLDPRNRTRDTARLGLVIVSTRVRVPSGSRAERPDPAPAPAGAQP